MNGKRGLLVVLTLGVCSGQMCGAPVPTPGLVGSATRSVIPEGIYTGTVVISEIGRANGVIEYEHTTDQTYSAVFGPEGLPLTADNRPIYVGYTFAVEVGVATGERTITSIQSVSNGATIAVRVEGIVDRLEGPSIRLTGHGLWTYVLNPDGSLEYLYVVDLGGTDPADGAIIVFYREENGQLTR